MTVSIIIPTYNRNKLLCNTITSVLQFQNQYHELIVVDQTKEHDKETELLLKKLKKEKKITLLQIDFPNLPNARNEGIRAASGDIVIFLDDDVKINEQFIPTHLSLYDNPKIGGTTGHITVVNPEKNDNIVFKNSLSLKSVLKSIFFFFIRNKASYVSRLGVISNFSGTKKLYADTGIGCNLAFRREIFERCGCFDVNYTGNAIREDTDMCLRIRRAGYKIIYHPQASLIHYMENSGGTRDSDMEAYWKTFFKNQCYFYIKNFSSSKSLIRFVLTLDLVRCKKTRTDVLQIFSEAYTDAVKYLSKGV
jgi:GT2 family glycosyltransferase